MPGRTLGSLALLGGILAACGTNAERDGEAMRQDQNDSFAHITVAPDRVAAGEQVTLTLMNRGEQQLGYNLCPASLERQSDDGWEERSERPAEVCTMELRILEPGSSATYEHTIPQQLPPGTYRFRAQVEWPLGGDQVSVSSEQFEIAE